MQSLYSIRMYILSLNIYCLSYFYISENYILMDSPLDKTWIHWYLTFMRAFTPLHFRKSVKYICTTLLQPKCLTVSV